MGIPSGHNEGTLASEDVYEEVWYSVEEFPDFPAGHWYMTDKARFSLTKTMTIYLRFYRGGGRRSRLLRSLMT